MKTYFHYFLLCLVCVAVHSCADKTQSNAASTDNPDLWSAIPNLSLPQTWSQVPDSSQPADSILVSHLQLQPDSVSTEPEWRVVGKIGTDQWRGLVYTFTDVDVSELHLATYTPADSLLNDVVLINDQIVGILTRGTFSASISPTFTIQTSERLRSAASETDSTIVSDEQTDQKFQIEPDGLIRNTANTATNHVANAATHPEEEEEGAYYREYRYESPGQAESFLFTIMGQEREKHYSFENAKGGQRALTLTGVAENNPHVYSFVLDGERVAAEWTNYTKDEDFSIPQTIIFTFANGTKQTFTLKK